MDESVDDKVRDLQRSLDLLRAEVDMKMSIIEQILSTRNEQFVAQKKLIEREHALYENVLGHWKNVTGLAASGHCIRYSKQTQDFQVVESPKQDVLPMLMKRSVSTAGLNTETDRRIVRAKRLRSANTREEVQDDTEANYHVEVSHDVDEFDDTQLDTNSVGDSDPEYGDFGDALEKRVFVNFYSEELTNPDEGSSDPIWLHFLREEKGQTALCKHCDNQGFQKIYQLKVPGMAVLRRHLRRIHKIFIEAPPAPPSPEVIEPLDTSQPQLRRVTLLRHNDYLYKRYKKRNQTEYYRCRDSDTCGGRLIRRNGLLHNTSEHSCLTTAADCDAAEFREKIRSMAETSPLPPADIIALVKTGYSQDVLALVPNDDYLRRTIRRIRQTMESVTSANNLNDWS